MVIIILSLGTQFEYLCEFILLLIKVHFTKTQILNKFLRIYHHFLQLEECNFNKQGCSRLYFQNCWKNTNFK